MHDFGFKRMTFYLEKYQKCPLSAKTVGLNTISFSGKLKLQKVKGFFFYSLQFSLLNKEKKVMSK